MGPETDLPDTSQMVVQYQDPATGQWHDLKHAGSFEFTPELPPGSIFGVAIRQRSQGVYEVPDSLLRENGVDELWSFSSALARQFEEFNPGMRITVERDVVNHLTLFIVEEVT